MLGSPLPQPVLQMAGGLIAAPTRSMPFEACDGALGSLEHLSFDSAGSHPEAGILSRNKEHLDNRMAEFSEMASLPRSLNIGSKDGER